MAAATERLFWADPPPMEFEAAVVRAERRGEGWAVVLDRSGFFPAAGGQPADRGTIGPGRVVDVVEEGEEIVHLVEGPGGRPAGSVRCAVDADRRIDLACQHTAQHLVSALAAALFGARTVGFRLGDRATTVDLEGGGLEAEGVRALERAANAAVREDRAVRIAFESGRARRVGTGMVPEDGALRIVSIDGLGESACCGAHVDRLGRIGAIRLGRTEKVRGALRVELFAGDRVLAEAERLAGVLSGLSERTGAGIEELPAWADAALAGAKSLKRENAELAARCAALEAGLLFAGSEVVGTHRLVARVVPDRDAKALRLLAQAIGDLPGAVAVVGAAHDGEAALVVVRAEGVALDVRPALKAAAAALGAKGGGTAGLAQCGGGDPAKLEAAVEAAKTLARAAPDEGGQQP